MVTRKNWEPDLYVVTNGIFFNLDAPLAPFRSGAEDFITLFQNVATVVGERYRLTYSVLNQNSKFNQFDVTTGSVFTSTSFEAPFEDFLTVSQKFTTTFDNSLIQFAVKHGGVNGNFFFADDASLINIVPEPESSAMLIAGFGLIGAASRRRRNSCVLVA